MKPLVPPYCHSELKSLSLAVIELASCTVNLVFDCSVEKLSLFIGKPGHSGALLRRVHLFVLSLDAGACADSGGLFQRDSHPFLVFEGVFFFFFVIDGGISDHGEQGHNESKVIAYQGMLSTQSMG
jgi:hypothetical protein